uniref:Mediator complex subunit 9 n=1 Tax=Panagrellus redivivus TaxID=6233 RepID=A0A7E4URS1_PANRE
MSTATHISNVDTGIDDVNLHSIEAASSLPSNANDGSDTNHIHDVMKTVECNDNISDNAGVDNVLQIAKNFDIIHAYVAGKLGYNGPLPSVETMLLAERRENVLNINKGTISDVKDKNSNNNNFDKFQRNIRILHEHLDAMKATLAREHSTFESKDVN